MRIIQAFIAASLFSTVLGGHKKSCGYKTQLVSFETLSNGYVTPDDSVIGDSPRYVVHRSADEFTNFWLDYSNDDEEVASVDEIDFTQEMVLVARANGEDGKLDGDMTVMDVREGSDAIIVFVLVDDDSQNNMEEMEQMESEQMDGAVQYHLIKMPASSKKVLYHEYGPSKSLEDLEFEAFVAMAEDEKARHGDHGHNYIAIGLIVGGLIIVGTVVFVMLDRRSDISDTDTVQEFDDIEKPSINDAATLSVDGTDSESGASQGSQK